MPGSATDAASLPDYSEYTAPLAPSSTSPAQEESAKSPNDISTIAQSEATMAMMLAIMMHVPILVPPPHEPSAGLRLERTALITSAQTVNDQVKESILKGWQNNIEQLSAQIKAIVNSPAYQELQRNKIHGDSKSAAVSGVQSASSANVAAANPVAGGSFNIISAIEQALSVLRMADTHPSKESDSAEGVVPMTALVFMQGALVLGEFESSVSPTGMTSNPVPGSMQILDTLQSNLNLSPDQSIPMINLAVIFFIYSLAAEEAISRFNQNEGKSDLEKVQAFARDVIRMVSNPDYVMANFVNKMEGTDRMDPDRKAIIATTMRLILATVALSLLHSLEMGKVQQGEYWGMLAEDLKAVLMGEKNPPADSKQEPTEIERLSSTLVKLVRDQIAALPENVRASTIETILHYIESSHDVEKMLDPAKLITEEFKEMEVIQHETDRQIGSARV